ncbi:MAG: hypothetical protein ABWX94_02065 [Candidatus Saccharimonadales bacterium]
MSAEEFPQTPHPDEVLVTLPISQVAGWLERLQELEAAQASFGLETQQQSDITDAAPKQPHELFLPNGNPTIEYAKASLSGKLLAYATPLIVAFDSHVDKSSFTRSRLHALQRAPEYINTRGWNNHVNKYGLQTSWKEDVVHGESHLKTTHLHYDGIDELARFEIRTETSNPTRMLGSVAFTFIHGHIVSLSSSTKYSEGKWPRTANWESAFGLDIEPLLRIHSLRRYRNARNVTTYTRVFDEKRGTFRGDSNDTPLQKVHKRLDGTLTLLVPEGYRPITLTS